ncbi:DUF2254 domain-containing protein [Palleronia sp. KMU-117]|uniref:DUF2254 domain-containing protein n=1 Tax=Palleronia sp. KMU-117 TaxID=3434108 RepID=UPI003D71209C
MFGKYLWHLRRTLRRIWVRVSAFALLALAVAAVAPLIGPAVPPGWGTRLGASSVEQVLTILASSMLAVTTFSLSIAVSAFAAAANTATPRATALLQEDPTTQNVLATFLGAFLFSLVALIALQAGYYDEAGRFILFAATGAVVVVVVVALLRWITHLTSFGRMGDTLDRVEAAAAEALAERLAAPYLGGAPLLGDIPSGVRPIAADTVGYVQHIDMAALAACAKEAGVRVWLAALPGAFVHPARPLLSIEGAAPSEDRVARIRAAFSIGRDRSFDQDPRFGLIVLAEIASRALSPAVNDPGTAIATIGRLVRVLMTWSEPVDPEVNWPEVVVPPLVASDMIEDAFLPIARDGAGVVEVQLRLQKGLAALAARSPAVFGEAATALSASAVARCRAAGMAPEDLARVEAASRLIRVGLPAVAAGER